MFQRGAPPHTRAIPRRLAVAAVNTIPKYRELASKLTAEQSSAAGMDKD